MKYYTVLEKDGWELSYNQKMSDFTISWKHRELNSVKTGSQLYKNTAGKMAGRGVPSSAQSPFLEVGPWALQGPGVALLRSGHTQEHGRPAWAERTAIPGQDLLFQKLSSHDTRN